MIYSEWETCAYTQGLRTKRQKRRLLVSDRDKQLLEIFNRLEEIRAAKQNLGYEAIHPPVQKGWKRTFVLKHETAIGRDAELFERILERINTVQYSHRSDFKKKRRHMGRKIYLPCPQEPAVLYSRDVYAQPLSLKEQGYFRQERRMIDHRGNTIPVYVFTEPWRFTLKIMPHLLTHRRRIDPELEAAEKRLEAYMSRHNLWPRYYKTYAGRYRWWISPWDPRPKHRYIPCLYQTARQALDEALRQMEA